MGQIKANQFKGAVLFFLVASMSSCMVVRPGANKSGKHLYESFFISLQTNQYFIKPMEFTSEDDAEIWLDFTFRDKNESRDSATVNFTLHFDEIVKSIDSIKIENGIQQTDLRDISYIYTIKKKEKYNSRFTSKSSNPSQNSLFNDKEWLVRVYFDSKSYTFKPTRRTADGIYILEEQLINIIRE